MKRLPTFRPAPLSDKMNRKIRPTLKASVLRQRDLKLNALGVALPKLQPKRRAILHPDRTDPAAVRFQRVADDR